MDIEIIYRVGNEIAARIKNGGKLILMGNGGSAADALRILKENNVDILAIVDSKGKCIRKSYSSDTSYHTGR